MTSEEKPNTFDANGALHRQLAADSKNLSEGIAGLDMKKSLYSNCRRFWKTPLPNKLNSLRSACYRLKGILYYRWVFGSFGSGSILYKPILVCNPQYIHIGKNVLIREGARLEAVILDSSNPPRLEIGDNVNIEQGVQIVFLGRVIIHRNVSITARCALMGGTHPFFDVHSPTKIGDRIAGLGSQIEIGEGSFIGIGSVISPNVHIGKHVVVGSNSVVKKNVPDYSVVEGNPAAVVMIYDQTEDRWANVKRQGESGPYGQRTS